jgi:5'-nucleotidase
MQKALLVNDDGYKAGGIRALQRAFSAAYDVVAVAPEKEQSWMGKSISGHHELTMTPVTYHEFDGWHVNGTPADCAQLGLYETGERPDFVVSGLNHGANIGHAHIMSSGTVGAAFEAAFQGVPAFAASVWQVKRMNPGADFNSVKSVDLFTTPADITLRIVQRVLAAGFPERAQVIAINIPFGVKPDAPWVVTKPHHIPYGRVFAGDGGVYRNAERAVLEGHEAPATDLAALAAGYISIVPITLQLSSRASRAELAALLDIPIFE